MADTLTGQRGITVWAAEPKFGRGNTSFEVHFGYSEHELSGMTWKCTGRRHDGRWEVVACTWTMAS